MNRSLSEWLDWQASLNPHEIELGLERVRRVLGRLPQSRPAKAVFVVGGTNGKGSTVAFIEQLCLANGLQTAAYTSPHLVCYNERVRLNGLEVADEWLVEQFTAVDAARGDVPLTYFEFGTLAALRGFAQARVDAWILEVGLGGRLDAVNVVDADVSVVTTVALEHQQWLGETLDEIAAEKAGILRRGRPAFYGDAPVPQGFGRAAEKIGARVAYAGVDFGQQANGDGTWSWRGAATALDGLPHGAQCPPDDQAQLRNVGLALAAVEACDSGLLNRPAVVRALGAPRPCGRFQVVDRDSQWILDVAHNPQAADLLRQRMLRLDDRRPLTVVIGMLADKNAAEFVSRLVDLAARWYVCPVHDARGLAPATLAATIERAGGRNVAVTDSAERAFAAAQATSGAGGRVLVTGSFHVVGPALSWLGLY